MLRIVLLVGFVGFAGSILRYLASSFVQKLFYLTFPFGTLFVNIVGSLIIGFLFGLGERGSILSPEARLFLATGFCGGFTTFSTFSLESLSLIRDGQWLFFSLYAIGSVVLGLLFVFIGFWLSKLF